MVTDTGGRIRTRWGQNQQGTRSVDHAGLDRIADDIGQGMQAQLFH